MKAGRFAGFGGAVYEEGGRECRWVGPSTRLLAFVEQVEIDRVRGREGGR